MSLTPSYLSYVRAYCFTFIGFIVLVCNLFIFCILVRVRRMRSSYAILIFALLTNALCGAISLSSGIYRFMQIGEKYSYTGSRSCFYLSPGLLEQWATLVVSTVLLANSIDRLIVVTKSIYYFKNQRAIVKTLIFIAFIVPTIICGVSSIFEFTLPERIVDSQCLTQILFADPAEMYIDCIRTAGAAFSIIIMLCVMVIMRKKQKAIQEYREKTCGKPVTSTKFLTKRQTSYTISALLCNLCTLVLFVIPMVFQFCADMAQVPWLRQLKTFVVILTYINQMNIMVTFVPRQKDIARCVLDCTYYKFVNRRNMVTVTTTSGYMNS